jgi:hypothetical protein
MKKLNVAFIILTVVTFIVTFCIICTYTNNTSDRLYFSITNSICQTEIVLALAKTVRRRDTLLYE